MQIAGFHANKKEELSFSILLSSGEKTPETVIFFKYTECTFDLNKSVHSERCFFSRSLYFGDNVVPFLQRKGDLIQDLFRVRADGVVMVAACYRHQLRGFSASHPF